MVKKIEKNNLSEHIEEILVFEEDNPDVKETAFRINKKKKEIVFFPNNEKYKLKKIVLKGFDKIPDEFSDKGYIKAGVTYYLNKKLKQFNVERITISKNGSNSIRKVRKAYNVTLSYNTLVELKKNIAGCTYNYKLERSNLVDNHFYKLFPRRYSKVDLSSKQKVNRLIKSLDENIIEDFEHEDVNSLLNFFERFLSKKYKSNTHKHKLFSSAKIKVDDIAISEIIRVFEKMLKLDPPESKWGEYLKKNLFLIDSKYVQVIPELNVVLAGYRKVDFGLIDSQGYLDIFEIKKPSTALLAKNDDRGNFYWSTEAIKAIVQAEKYLFNAESKAADLERDIKREKRLNVDVIKPRAVLIIGNSKQLRDDNRRNDFRILRMALKNIEIVLYDELLERIRNQKNKIYIN